MSKTIGSRAEVWHGNAKMTSGRLTKDNLHKNKLGRIVSKKKSLKHSKDPNKKAFLEAFKLNENPIDKNIDLNEKLSSIY